jgi:uncharacterized protein YecT (DUF1311 family)
MDAAYQKAVDRLETSMKDLPEHADGIGREKTGLVKAQELFFQYRDTNCEMYAQSGGSIARLLSNDCIVRMTAERAQELEALLRP